MIRIDIRIDKTFEDMQKHSAEVHSQMEYRDYCKTIFQLKQELKSQEKIRKK